MSFTSYKVQCLKCGGSDILKITHDKTVHYTNHVPIIAARFRPDLNWGFECQCGNDSRLAPSERDQIGMLVRGGEHAIDAITKSLEMPVSTKFSMELA